MGLTISKLLEHDIDLPDEARRALAEDRLVDAARVLMDAYDLSCRDAGQLVGERVCEG